MDEWRLTPYGNICRKDRIIKASELLLRRAYRTSYLYFTVDEGYWYIITTTRLWLHNALRLSILCDTSSCLRSDPWGEEGQKCTQ